MTKNGKHTTSCVKYHKTMSALQPALVPSFSIEVLNVAASYTYKYHVLSRIHIGLPLARLSNALRY